MDVYFVPAHWNRNAACMIPDAWAVVRADGQQFHCDSEEEAREMLAAVEE